MTVASYATHGQRRWALLIAAAAGALLMYVLRDCGCGAAGSAQSGAGGRPMTEAELHQKGLWRSPRLGVDAFIARHVKSRDSWEVLLVQRAKEPHKGAWCLPGGFVFWMEDPVAAVVREVKEETHLAVDMKRPPEFVTFRGSPKRDPRAHSLSASYVTKVEEASLKQLQNDDDAGPAQWFPIKQAADGTSLRFAFDHGDILRACAEWFERQGRAKGLYAEVDSA